MFRTVPIPGDTSVFITGIPLPPIEWSTACSSAVTRVHELDESVEAWRACLYQASAVMLGCACERLILILAETIAGSTWQPFAGKLEKKLSRRVFISQLFDDILAALRAENTKKALPSSISDAFERRLSAIFDHTRILRNQAGHPTGAEITIEEADAGLLLFSGFYALVDEICIHCKANNL